MDRQVVAAAFRRVFEVTSLRPREVRGQRSGRVDGTRLAAVAAGNTRVFAQRQPEATQTAAGSLAICTSLQDLYSVQELAPLADEYRAQAEAYREVMETLYACAASVGIPARFFATNRRGGWQQHDGVTHVDCGTIEDLRKVRGTNTWVRHRECVEDAERWHAKVAAAGRRITLLVTTMSEVRTPEACHSREAYLKEIAETAASVTKWTLHSAFSAVGVMMEAPVTVGALWGQNVEDGIHRAFREAFPSGTRYNLEAAEELPQALRELATRTAKGP